MIFNNILVYIGIFIFYTGIMKIHIYKWEFDKIPLNAVPFYKDDTMYDYYLVEEMYNSPLFFAGKWRFVSAKEIMSLDEEVPVHFPESDIMGMNCTLDKKPLDIFDASWDWDMIILEKEERWNWLIINVVYDENIDFRWFLNLCNEHYKEKWYEHIAYHFEVGHKKKPNIWREEYDMVARMGATDNYMWTRCYIKYFNKKK